MSEPYVTKILKSRVLTSGCVNVTLITITFYNKFCSGKTAHKGDQCVSKLILVISSKVMRCNYAQNIKYTAYYSIFCAFFNPTCITFVYVAREIMDIGEL